MPILVVDVVALWLLNLVANLDMWVTVLFFEGLVLIFFGIPPSAGGRKLRRILGSGDVYMSGRLAGAVLIIIAAFVVSHYY